MQEAVLKSQVRRSAWESWRQNYAKSSLEGIPYMRIHSAMQRQQKWVYKSLPITLEQCCRYTVNTQYRLRIRPPWLMAPTPVNPQAVLSNRSCTAAIHCLYLTVGVFSNLIIGLPHRYVASRVQSCLENPSLNSFYYHKREVLLGKSLHALCRRRESWRFWSL